MTPWGELLAVLEQWVRAMHLWLLALGALASFTFTLVLMLDGYGDQPDDDEATDEFFDGLWEPLEEDRSCGFL